MRILGLIAEQNFAVKAFAKDCSVSQRTIENDIIFLKQHQLIAYEGSPIAGKYVITKQFDTWSKSKS